MSKYLSCHIPDRIPGLYDFFCELTDAVFPELFGKNEGYSAYSAACMRAVKQVGLLDEGEAALTAVMDGYIVEENSDLFRLMYEMNEAHKIISGKAKDIDLVNPETTVSVKSNTGRNYPPEHAIRAYKAFSYTLSAFCENNTMRTWRTPPKNGTGVTAAGNFFKGAVLFTYLLLKRPECKDNVLPFFERCLGYLGIQIESDIIKSVLEDFGFEHEQKEVLHGNVPFNRLSNRATRLLGICVMTLLEYAGRYSAEGNCSEIERLHGLFDDSFKDEMLAQDTVYRLRSNLFALLNVFEPRSISGFDAKLQDVFTLPKFERNGTESQAPEVAISNASYSECALIVSKTGLGKSAYLQMLTLCTLKDAFGESLRESLERCKSEDVRKRIKASADRLTAIGEKMKLPEDIFVMHIPARMFSTVYGSNEHKEASKDLVTLFFHAVCNLADRYPFYTERLHNVVPSGLQLERIRPAIYKYVHFLAEKGRLLLILDSFDEIAPGEMRTAYLNAVQAFIKGYCDKGRGAHVMLATREMSFDTMSMLIGTLQPLKREYYTIRPLDENGRRELITNWSAYKSDGENYESDIAAIEGNRIRRELSCTPYMLSVLYLNLSRNTSDIINDYISKLNSKILTCAPEISAEMKLHLRDVGSLIIPDLALESVIGGKKTVDSRDVRDAVKKLIREKGIFTEEEDIRDAAERLVNIIVTEVGLIVPADGCDDAFQFIEEIIRYHLAASRISDLIHNRESYEAYSRNVLSHLPTESFVRLALPLLCSGTSSRALDIETYAALVSELAFRSFENESENALLTTAATDILIASYGISYATAVGGADAQIIKRIQRTLLSRILTSQSTALSAKDRERLLSSVAWRTNSDFFSKAAASVLEG